MLAAVRLIARLSTQPQKLVIPYEKGQHNRVRAEIGEAIYSMGTCRQYAAFLKDNLTLLTEKDMATIFTLINEREIARDNHFREVLLPVLAEHVKVYTREHAEALASIAIALAEMGVSDGPVWQALEGKLVGERLARYVSVARTVDVAHSLLRARLGSSALLSCLNETILHHGAYLASIPEYVVKVKAMLPQLERIEQERQQLKAGSGPKQLTE
jgi:hypothetical protein